MSEIEVIVETIRVSRRKEEGPRKHVHLSFPVRSHPEISQELDQQLGNVMLITLTALQPRLPEETETVRMSVDGEDANVVKPKRSRRSRDNGAAPDGDKLAEMTAWGNTPHAFEAHTGDNRCAKCGLDAEQDLQGEPLHVSAAAAGLIEDARRTPATEDEAREQADAEARLANQSKG